LTLQINFIIYEKLATEGCCDIIVKENIIFHLENTRQ